MLLGFPTLLPTSSKSLVQSYEFYNGTIKNFKKWEFRISAQRIPPENRKNPSKFVFSVPLLELNQQALPRRPVLKPWG